jgi:protein-tyrosine phosphatase
VVDVHTHVLPGIDDGASDLDDAVEIVRLIAADGARTIVATPHVRDDYPTTPDQMDRALTELRDAAATAGIEVELLSGGEISLSSVGLLDDETLARFGLGGNPGLLLLEFPDFGWPLSLSLECGRLLEKGIIPMIAHPERNPATEKHLPELARLVSAGAIVQLTAASVDGRSGRAAAARARQLLELELAHVIASDAHSPAVRRGGLAAATGAVGDELGSWLTSLAPAALLDGAPLPPRPAARRRRWGRVTRARR